MNNHYTLPGYFVVICNKIYCNHQKLAIYVMMQKLKSTSRGIISWLRSNEKAKLILGLSRIPVHTTIIRFAKKINKYLHLILNIRAARIAAVDATGFEL
mgnify:CR=1 FL=1